MIDQEMIHFQCLSEDPEERIRALEQLRNNFSLLPDKLQTWNDLIRLTNDKDRNVHYKAADCLGSVFSQVPDKQYVWNDLVRLTNDKESYLRYIATEALSSIATEALNSAFSQLPDKQQVWEDLLRLTIDGSLFLRDGAAEAIGAAFSCVPEKQQAWNNFPKLKKKELRLRLWVFSALGSVFSDLPDKQRGWNDLIRLTNVKCSFFAKFRGVNDVLGYVFSQVPDRQQAWEDLHRLANDEYRNARFKAAEAIGSIFSQVPDKQEAWNDLHRLITDEDRDLRAQANHSLGRVSIFNASQAEKDEDYKKELEKAIKFFETSVNESPYMHPSEFCLPFYRSFYSIIFKKQEARDEVNKYLEEAKVAIGASESKKQLFKAVENLANALKEVQNLENLDLDVMKSELNFYRQYCDRAAEFMRDTEETAPFATGVIRKGLPILDRNLKEIVEEIQKKAKTVCQVSQGTATQEIACAINRKVQSWKAGTEEEIARDAEELLIYMKSIVPKFPENEHIFEKIKEVENKKHINLLLRSISDLFRELPNIIIDPERIKPTIGIITALPKEYAAVYILLENKKDKYQIPGSGAGRRYCLGELFSEKGNTHNLVLAMVGVGNNIAAASASLLLEHFPNVRSIIMVGIAGGAPNPDNADDHVRLGDIVVSNEYGVIQYDNIKKETQKIIFRNPPRAPSASLLEAVKYLQVEEILGNRPWEKYISQSVSKLRITRPSEDKDIIYSSSDKEKVLQHPEDLKRIKGQPRVFIGPIASANILQKDPKERDNLRDKFKVKAVEMESSGIADATWVHEVGYLVVRGVCDYCDSKKNDEWQPYAAVVAAAYTRALIESMP